MRLFGYGIRRGLPAWAAVMALFVAGASGVTSATEAGRLLDSAGLTDAAGVHRAHLWSFFGLLAFVLAAWRGAELGNLLVHRDKSWIAPRPASSALLAASLVLGSASAAWLFAIALGLGVELQAGGGPGRQQLMTPSGPEILRLASEPSSAQSATWQVAKPGSLPEAARIEVLVRPLAGGGRSATLGATTEAGATTFTIGTTRRINIQLGPSGALELTHGDTGPALAIFPAEARITTPIVSRRRASTALGLRLGILLTAAAALALGLGTRLGASLAALLTLAIFAPVHALGLSDWFAALMTTEAGLVPRWPALDTWQALLISLLIGWALLTRALGKATRGGQA